MHITCLIVREACSVVVEGEEATIWLEMLSLPTAIMLNILCTHLLVSTCCCKSLPNFRDNCTKEGCIKLVEEKRWNRKKMEKKSRV